MLVVIDTTANIVDGVVVILLIAGVLFSAYRSTRTLLRERPAADGRRMHEALRVLRIDLGHFLLLGLELLIVSDILHSIVKRSMEEIAILAVTVLIRISLSYFLNKEIAELSQGEDRT